MVTAPQQPNSPYCVNKPVDASLHCLHGCTGQRSPHSYTGATGLHANYHSGQSAVRWAMLEVIRHELFDFYGSLWQPVVVQAGHRPRVRTLNPCMVCDTLTHASTDCPEAPAQTKRDKARQVTAPNPKHQCPFAKTWAANICVEFNSKGYASLVPGAATAMCAESVLAATQLAPARHSPVTHPTIAV